MSYFSFTAYKWIEAYLQIDGCMIWVERVTEGNTACGSYLAYSAVREGGVQGTGQVGTHP